MNPDDERLRALFQDAVSDVEPRDGLAEVRRRTRARRTSSSRRWAPVLAGAGAMAATVVAATLFVNGLGDDGSPDREPPVASTSESPPTTAAAGIYFISDTVTGPRLFREFQVVGLTPDPAQKTLLALQRLTEDFGPRDPDYRSAWPSGSFGEVTVEEDRIVVELGSADALRAQAVGEDVAWLVVQQAVYTAEAAVGETLPVAFEWNGQPARTVLGFRVGALVARARGYEITTPVNISDPSEELAIDDGSLEATGTMADYVRQVRWSLESTGPDPEPVLRGRATPVDITGPDAGATLGAPGWETGVIDVSGLAPGDYVFAVTVTDVGQTSDTRREFSDTRTISIR